MADEPGLIRRLQAGDKRAFRDLAERLAPTALSVATRVTANRDIAEEAVQEAFVDVWRKAERYDSKRGGLRSWVLAVVHNKAVDAVRRERTATDASSKVPEPAPSVDPADETLEADMRGRVREAVDALPSAQREAIMLAYFGGLTYRQVAERLDIPEGTAKSRLRDGLMNLRVQLERRGVTQGWAQL
jgi:RNA polymerase sigma-70 factor (ECF subfamily)